MRASSTSSGSSRPPQWPTWKRPARSWRRTCEKPIRPTGVRLGHVPSIYLPTPGRRAIVVGAGSFGTAVAVLLARGGLRTTLQARTADQARELSDDRENRVYLPGVELPRELRIEDVSAGLNRAEFVFLGVPSRGLDEVIAGLREAGLPSKAAVVSLAKGLVPPDGRAPSELLRGLLGEGRVAVIGGPAHAREMVHEGAA